MESWTFFSKYCTGLKFYPLAAKQQDNIDLHFLNSNYPYRIYLPVRVLLLWIEYCHNQKPTITIQIKKIIKLT